MTHSLQKRRAGVGTAVGAVILFSAFWTACAPGSLPCNSNEEWKETCSTGVGGTAGIDNSGGGGTANGGGSGGTANNGGTGGTANNGGSGSGGNASAGGTGGSATPGVVSASTAINGCSAYKTLGDMDKFFAMRCGVDPSCHGTGAPWTDMKMPDIWKRLQDKKPAFSCSSGKLIDMGNWQNSVLLAKTKAAPVVCPTGGNPNSIMPPADQTIAMKQPAMTADESACLQGFLKAVTGK